MDASCWFYSVFSEQGLYFGGFLSNVSVYDVHFCFVFIHENIIFAQCLFVNVNLFPYCLVFPFRVCASVCVMMGESLCACMRTRAVFLLLSRPYRSHFLLEKKKNIVVALSQVCGYI